VNHAPGTAILNEAKNFLVVRVPASAVFEAWLLKLSPFEGSFHFERLSGKSAPPYSLSPVVTSN
jgi:hypothetical protein